MQNIAREVYKTCITDLELSTTPLMDGCHNDNVIQLGPLRSRSLFQFVQISDAYYFTSSLPTRYNQLDSNLANLEATVAVEYIMEILSISTQW